MVLYRVEWGCCDGVTETDGWAPTECPFCALGEAEDEVAQMVIQSVEDERRLRKMQETISGVKALLDKACTEANDPFSKLDVIGERDLLEVAARDAISMLDRVNHREGVKMSIARGCGDPRERIAQLEEINLKNRQLIDTVMNEISNVSSILGVDFAELPNGSKTPLVDKAQEVIQNLAREKSEKEKALEERDAAQRAYAESEERVDHLNTRIERLEELLRRVGVCPDCGEVPEMDEEMALSSCLCGAGEDYGNRPMQHLQLMGRLIRQVYDEFKRDTGIQRDP